MIILKLILGLVIIIGVTVGAIVSLGLFIWLCSVVDNKTKGTIIEKIFNIIDKVFSYAFEILIWGLFIVVVIGVAINIGASIIK